MKVTLHNAQQLPMALREIEMWAKAHLMAGQSVVLSAAKPTRKEIKSRKFHALCGDVERSGFPWADRPRTKNQWKHLFVSGHMIATQDVELIRGLEDEVLNIRESTAEMVDERMSSLIEYTTAFCAMNRIPTLWKEHA